MSKPKQVQFKSKTVIGTSQVYNHLTEHNALRGGEGAFKIRVPLYANPYKENPLKSAWIRGYKRAERAFFEAGRLSQKIQATVGFEEVEG